MLKQLIKLSNYLNNSKYSSELNKIIKVASDLESSHAILWDYLLENELLKEKEKHIIKSYLDKDNKNSLFGIYTFIYIKYKDSHPLINDICQNIYTLPGNEESFYREMSRRSLPDDVDFYIIKDIIKIFISKYQETHELDDDREHVFNLLLQAESVNELKRINSDELIIFYIIEPEIKFLCHLIATYGEYQFTIHLKNIVELLNIDFGSLFRKYVPTLDDLFGFRS